MKSFKDLNIKNERSNNFVGNKIEIRKLFDREIEVHKYEVKDSKFKDKNSDKCLCMQIVLDDKPHIVFTGSEILTKTLGKIPQESFPFKTKIVRNNEGYEFT